MKHSVRPQKYNVLVFPGGTEIGLEINHALQACKEIRLYSAGLAIPNHAPFVFARHFELPSIYESEWLDHLIQFIDQEKIDFIFPAYDDVIVALATRAHVIPAHIVTSPLNTCLIARSKLRTYKYFSDLLPTPTVYSSLSDIEDYPVFVKPDISQGSQGAERINSPEQLRLLIEQYALQQRELVIMEYLAGREFTVDCFSHRDQGLLYCAGRERIRTKNGISMASRHVSDPVFRDFATIISKSLTFHGAWFFQLKQDQSGVYKLLEVAPRIAGTMALSRGIGVNFPLLSIYEALGTPLSVSVNEMSLGIDRALINRYSHDLTFTTIYIDLDDLLIVDDKVNLAAIRLVYQCINKGIRVVLLTRHRLNLDATLKHYRLSMIFDEIIHVGKDQHKADFITDLNSIFIDDSFQERQQVKLKKGIPTFDSSMIEVLFDDRV